MRFLYRMSRRPTPSHLLIVVFMISVTYLSADQEDPSIPSIVLAPTSFEQTQTLPQYDWLSSYIPTEIAGRLARNVGIQIVERQQLNRVLEEIELAVSDLSDDSPASFSGFAIASHIMVGSTAVFGARISVSARIVDVSSGIVTAHAQADGESDQLFDVIATVTAQLAEGIGGYLNDYSVQPDRLRLSAHRTLYRAAVLWSDLPFHELDPARRRRRAEYQMLVDGLDELLMDSPGLPEAYEYLGHFNHQLGMDDRAEAYFEALVAFESASARGLVGLGDIARHAYRPEEALEHYAQATEVSPMDAGAWYGLMQTYLDLGNPDAAAHALLRAMEICPELAVLHARLRSLTEALSSITTDRDPAAAVQALHGWYYLRSHRYEEAVLLLGVLQDTYPSLYFIPLAEGMLYLSTGAYQRATEALLRSRRMYPGHAPTHLALGDAYAGLGENRNAVAHWLTYIRFSDDGSDFAAVRRKIQAIE